LKSFSTLIFELVVKLPKILKNVKPLPRRHRLPVFEVGFLGLAEGTFVDGHERDYFIKIRIDRQTLGEKGLGATYYSHIIDIYVYLL
jgi:hypothetical protein